WLDVAMDDEIAVRVSHRRQHIEKEPDALPDIELLPLAIPVDVLAGYVFQDQIRLAAGGYARIEQPRDVRMLQAGEHTALAREAPLRRMPDESGAQQLPRRLPFDPAIASVREPHAAHATVAQRHIERVRAELLARQGRFRHYRRRLT